MFNVLGAVAQFERELINESAKEGIIKAKARGVKFGSSKKENAAMVSTILSDAHSWTGSKSELAKKYLISRATLYRIIENKPR